MAGFALSDAFIRLSAQGPDKAQVIGNVKAATAGVKGSVPIFADTSAAKARIAELAGIIQALQAKKADLLVKADNAPATMAQLLNIGVQLDRLNNRIASPKIKPIGLDSAIARAAALSAQLEHINDTLVIPAAAGGGGGGGLLGGGAAALGFLGWLKLAHLGVTVLGAQIAADTLGIAAFGAAAAGALGPIVSNWSTLTTTLGSLDRYQKAFVINIQHFMDALGGGNEAQLFGVFNEALGVLHNFLGGSGGLVGQATQAFGRFFAMLNNAFQSPGWQQLLHGTGGLVNKDLTALFGTISELIGVLPALVRGFNGVGLAFLKIIKSGLGFVGWALGLNKGLSTVVAAVGGVLTAWSLLGKLTPLPGPTKVLGPLFALAGAPLKGLITGLGAAATEMGGLAPALAGLAIAAAPVALPVIAVAGAVTVLGLAFANNRDTVGAMVDAIQRADQANQGSIPVWQHGVNVLQAHDAAAVKATHSTDQLGGVLSRLTGPTGAAYAAVSRITPALQQQRQGLTNLQQNYQYLWRTYGLTQQGSQALARTLGINLDQALTGNSKAAKEARFQIEQYVKTQQGALSPMSQFAFDVRQIGRDAGNQAARTQDLANAYQALLGPLTGAESAAGQLWPSMQQLTQAVRKDGTEVGLWSPKGADLAGKLSTATTNALGLSTQIFNMTGNVVDALRPTGLLVDKIKDLRLHGELAKQTTDKLVTSQYKLGQQAGLTTGQIVDLIHKLDGIPKSEVVRILMTGSGRFSITGPGGQSVAGPGGRFNSGRPAAAGWLVPGSGNADSVPAMLTPGEAVVPKRLVPHVAPFLAAHRVPGFAGGGYVGSVPGLGTFAQGMVADFRQTMTSAMVAAMRSALTSARQAVSLVHPTGSGGTIEALMRSMAASIGWTGSLWTDLFNVEEREAGFSLIARNPSSGAYGLAQFINGPSEYYQWGGNPYTAVGQITAMFNYIKRIYGSPAGAWASELTRGFYDQGGWLPPGLSMAWNGTGRPERVTGPGEGTGNVYITVNAASGAFVGGSSPLAVGQALGQFIMRHTQAGGRLYPIGVVPK